MRALFLAGLLATTLAATAAVAQTPVQRTRGTLTTVGPDSIGVLSRGGQAMTFSLTPKTRYSALSPAKLSDIGAGSFIGSAAVPGDDGTLRALEVTVFPPSMKGSGEGHRPWDAGPTSSMTNGTVGTFDAAQGNRMTVTYKGGQQVIEVPPTTPIVAISPGSHDGLKVGEKVVVAAADGKTAAFVLYGANGMTPPQ